MAKDAGYFEKYGFNVEPVQIRGGSLITLAIITGNLPFSGAGAESVIAARAAGADVILLACPVDVDPVYLITRPEIKSAAELKGHASAVTRYGSTTHFYLRTALRHVGLNPDRDMTILQLGAGPEMVAALEAGRIAAAALTARYAIPFLERNWPVLVDLSSTDLVYPSSCVASSRAFMRAEPKTTEDFLTSLCCGDSVDQARSWLCGKIIVEMAERKRPGDIKEIDPGLRKTFQARLHSCRIKGSTMWSKTWSACDRSSKNISAGLNRFARTGRLSARCAAADRANASLKTPAERLAAPRRNKPGDHRVARALRES